MPTPTTVPPLTGMHRTYRLYTVEHLPFDALPAYPDGGPSMVVVDGWSTSTSSTCRVFSSREVVAADDGMHTLRARRASLYGGLPGEAHPLDGTKYATRRDANRAAYNAGLLAYMVYDDKAAQYGLPTG